MVVGADERERELGIRGSARHHEEPHIVPLDRGPLVRFVSDSGVVGQGDPAPFSNRVQPLFVRAVWIEVVSMSLDRETGVLQDLAELQAEISVREVDDTQAARS